MQKMLILQEAHVADMEYTNKYAKKAFISEKYFSTQVSHFKSKTHSPSLQLDHFPCYEL